MHNKHKTHFKQSDGKMARLAANIKLPPLKLHTNHFQALAQVIIRQQLSDKAASAILNRFRALFPKCKFPSPNQVYQAGKKRLRQAGLSGAKAEFLKHLAKAFLDKKLSAAKFQRLTDKQIISHLTQIKGIGRWSAEMFLMFSLGRQDIFSPGDRGLQNAIARHYKLGGKIDEKKLCRLAERWRPYRSFACRYLWASLRSN